jgi:molybdopterin-guanine dinucleotide biosynthesis protein A
VIAGRAVAGAVLAGGASRRMGRDKALIEIDGVAMVARVAGALSGAGCGPVTVVGGDRAALEALGLVAHADRWPGEGPLGAVITALSSSAVPTMVVACDLPWLDSATVASVAGAALAAAGDSDPPIDVAVTRTDRLQPLCACWMPSALPVLERRFHAGERAVHRAIDDLAVRVVQVESAALRNVNTPRDLPPV